MMSLTVDVQTKKSVGGYPNMRHQQLLEMNVLLVVSKSPPHMYMRSARGIFRRSSMLKHSFQRLNARGCVNSFVRYNIYCVTTMCLIDFLPLLVAYMLFLQTSLVCGQILSSKQGLAQPAQYDGNAIGNPKALKVAASSRTRTLLEHMASSTVQSPSSAKRLAAGTASRRPVPTVERLEELVLQAIDAKNDANAKQVLQSLLMLANQPPALSTSTTMKPTTTTATSRGKAWLWGSHYG